MKIMEHNNMNMNIFSKKTHHIVKIAVLLVVISELRHLLLLLLLRLVETSVILYIEISTFTQTIVTTTI